MSRLLPFSRRRGEREAAGPRALAACVCVYLLVAFLGVSAAAGELSKEERKWANACLPQLGADSEAVRRGARRALTALGTDAVPLLAETWGDGRKAEVALRIELVLHRIGKKAVLQRLRHLRADARAAETRRLDALIRTLTAATERPEDDLSPGATSERAEKRWAKSCLAQLGANSPRVRTGAERALTELGVGAVPGLVDLWVQARGRAELAAVVRVLLEIGRDAVTVPLTALRADARGSRAGRLDELIAELGVATTPGSSTGLPLEAATDLDWRRVPIGAEHAVGERMPTALGVGLYPTRRDGAALLVDVDGDGTPETRIEPDASQVLRFRVRGAERPVLVYAKLGTWYACSASLLVGDGGRPDRPRPVQLLDGDLDGAFGGERDYLRVGDGAFQRCRADGTVLWGEDRARYAVDVGEDGAVLHLDVLERPGGATKAAREGLLALNRFRARHGLEPLGHDAVQSAACRKHAEYLATNVKRGGRKNLGGSSHDEDPALPGYTVEGAQAGASSNISSGGDLVRAVERIGRTMLHRVAWLCPGSVDAGFGATRRGGGWSVIWTGPGVADGPAPVLVPAPGDRHVPRRGSPEWPPLDRHPTAYENAVGYPVSVTYAPLPYEGVRLELFLMDDATAVPGYAFTPAQPVSDRFRRNAGSAFFLPSAPLTRGAWHWAVFTASLEGEPVRFAWTFKVE